MAAIAGTLCLLLTWRETNMKTKNTYLWKYFLGLFLLVTIGVAQTLTDWSAPVNLGPTVNAASAEL